MALLVAHNGHPCPSRIKVKSAEAKVLRKVHIEDIASSLGESVFFCPSEVWQEQRGILGENRLGLLDTEGPCSPSLPFLQGNVISLN